MGYVRGHGNGSYRHGGQCSAHAGSRHNTGVPPPPAHELRARRAASRIAPRPPRPPLGRAPPACAGTPGGGAPAQCAATPRLITPWDRDSSNQQQPKGRRGERYGEANTVQHVRRSHTRHTPTHAAGHWTHRANPNARHGGGAPSETHRRQPWHGTPPAPARGPPESAPSRAARWPGCGSAFWSAPCARGGPGAAGGGQELGWWWGGVQEG
jgi:hypothetical protein